MKKEKLILILMIVSGLIRNEASQCGQRSYSGNGDFNFNAGVKGSCEYHFKNQGDVTRISWKTFNVPGRMPDCSDKDYVKVYIG